MRVAWIAEITIHCILRICTRLRMEVEGGWRTAGDSRTSPPLRTPLRRSLVGRQATCTCVDLPLREPSGGVWGMRDLVELRVQTPMTRGLMFRV